MDLRKHYGMDLHELKALCDLLMVSDPFPLNYNKQQILEEFADRKANELVTEILKITGYHRSVNPEIWMPINRLLDRYEKDIQEKIERESKQAEK